MRRTPANHLFNHNWNKSPTKPKVEKEKNPEIDCEDPYGDLKKAEK